MKVVIQVSEKDKAKAVGILFRHSPGTALPDRRFIISEQAVQALKGAGVEFTELSREGETPNLQGAVNGERI